MSVLSREDRWLSLCGLNCALCPMFVGGYCPGCGGGAGNQPCAVQRCAKQREGIAYCYQCAEYPCEKYAGADARDSFITHLRQFQDMEKAKTIGLTAYHAEQQEKAAILKRLLNEYNDGRRKSFYCLAVNLLELPDLRTVMSTLENAPCDNAELKQRAEKAALLLRTVAEARGVTLRLRK